MAAVTTETNRLTTFQQHVDDMRNHIMCKICLKPLYEPFILACGHTYCYGCLRSWFTGLDSRRRKKNCPDCRAEVKLTPSPNYILRDLVHMFIGRAELLPEDETVDEHIAGKNAEAVLLAKDKDGKGLFEGIFRHSIHPLADHRNPLYDVNDGVSRCPHCLWEIEDGMCLHCGYEIDDDDDYPDFSSDEEDDDESISLDEQSIPSGGLSPEVYYDSEDGIPHHFYGAHSLADDAPSIGTDVYSEFDYGTPNPFDYDEEDDMQAFIDELEDADADEIDEDDMNEIALRQLRQLPRTSRRQYQIPDEEDEEDDDDDGEQEDESSQEDEPRQEQYTWHNYSRTHGTYISEDDSSSRDDVVDHDDEDDQQTNYDESDEESRSATPIAIPIGPTRRRPIIVSSDDEDNQDEQTHNADAESHTEGESQAEGMHQQADEDNDEAAASSDSDDTMIPTRSSNSRIQSNENPRKRRLTPDAWRAIARARRDDQTGPRRRQAINPRIQNARSGSRVTGRVY